MGSDCTVKVVILHLDFLNPIFCLLNLSVIKRFLKFSIPSSNFLIFALHILRECCSRTYRFRIVIALGLLLGVHYFIANNSVGYKVYLTSY